ncbi:hypothetical protein HPB47_005563 [Ixodes persulcatus]|uniref:Uncharacterized protein n=1 Tax=Ixodes persulcatus TaxID=34615 RepID=A0AC60PDK5_IXOPE|nr:hypothetical protein HPB47_005563 [Ixodes persulcatus]
MEFFLSRKAKSLRTALLLALAYASNFGSMVTFGGAQDYLRSNLTKYGEYVSIFLVIAAIVLLAFRDPFFMSEGWSQWLSVEQEVMAASVGLMVGLMAFLFPTDMLPGDHKTEIIAWGDLHKRLPWGVIFLIGGSSTISAAMEASLCLHKRPPDHE